MLWWFLAWNAMNVIFTWAGLWAIWPWFYATPDILAAQLAGMGIALAAIMLSSTITAVVEWY